MSVECADGVFTQPRVNDFLGPFGPGVCARTRSPLKVYSAFLYERWFDAIAKQGASGVVVPFDFLFAAQKQGIIALAAERRLPKLREAHHLVNAQLL